MKQVLVLGTGMVAAPLVRYLLDQPDIKLVVASLEIGKAEALVEKHPKGSAVFLDVNAEENVGNYISHADLVVSLLPYTLHVKIAKLCLKYRSHLVTTSYVSDDMKALDKDAKNTGVLLLNEMGLDPGIDHMSAMKIINDVQKSGAKIISFESCCGGLPAPEANDNPFGYKFSWSPRGVLMAGRNAAQFYKDGIKVSIAGKDLFKNYWLKNVRSLGNLEVYPNRNSLIYEHLYGLEGIETLIRGTFRNSGWCDTMLNMVKLGFLSEDVNNNLKGQSFSTIMAGLVGAGDNLHIAAAKYLGIDENSDVIKRMKWLGLFSTDIPETNQMTLLNVLASQMLKKLSYKTGERDMVVLQHEFLVEYASRKREHICSLLINFGIPDGDSAMARTVSLPAAVAAYLIVKNSIHLSGVHIPVIPEIYEPVLKELEKMNIKFQETKSAI